MKIWQGAFVIYNRINFEKWLFTENDCVKDISLVKNCIAYGIDINEAYSCVKGYSWDVARSVAVAS